jgi:hypothetical protein
MNIEMTVGQQTASSTPDKAPPISRAQMISEVVVALTVGQTPVTPIASVVGMPLSTR